MTKQLYKQGLRKCSKCKEILSANNINFTNGHKNRGPANKMSYICRKCSHSKPKRIRDIVKERYTDYKLGAKYRNIKWLVPFEEFKNFWQKPCYYCKDKIETIGLDKIDNKNSYSVENIVSCCSKCNYMKGKLTKEEFLSQCKKISEVDVSGF